MNSVSASDVSRPPITTAPRLARTADPGSSERERQEPGDERDGRHENRPEARPRALHDGLALLLAATAQRVRVVDD